MAHVELSLSEAFVPHASTTIEPEYGGSVALWTPTVASGPCDFDVTSRDTIWFGEMTAGKIGRLSVTS